MEDRIDDNEPLKDKKATALKYDSTKDNAKTCFIQTLKEFEFSMFAISEKDKSNLVEWVSKELNDLDCYILLLNIPEAIEELKKDINVFNRFRFLF